MTGLNMGLDVTLASDSCAVSAGLERSSSPSAIESLSNAPNCCWVARIDVRIFRANHRAAKRNVNWAKRLPNSYQLLCIQFMISFMAAPWVWHVGLGSPNITLCFARENWHKVQETASPCPAPAFHANFSQKKPLTQPTQSLMKNSPAGAAILLLPAPESLARPAITPQEAFMTHLIPRDNFFQDLFEFRRDFDQIFNRFLSWPSAQEESVVTTTALFTPPMECFVDKDGKKFHCNVALPGVDPKDVR